MIERCKGEHELLELEILVTNKGARERYEKHGSSPTDLGRNPSKNGE
jgi:hypothetical protein